MAYTDTEQTAVATSPLGGVTEPATEGPEETQVAGLIGTAASKIGNAVFPQKTRDRMSQGIMSSIMGKTGGQLNEARIKARDLNPDTPRQVDDLNQPITVDDVAPGTTVEEGVPDQALGGVEEPVTLNPVLEDFKPDAGAPIATDIPAAPEKLIEPDLNDRYIKVGIEEIDAVMSAPERRDELLGGGLSDFNAGKIPDANGVQERIEAISLQYAGKIDEEKRGVITNEVSRQLGDLVGADSKTMKKVAEAVMNRRKGEGINVEGMGMMESMLAARDMLVGEVRKLDGLAKTAAEGTREQLAAFRYQLEVVANFQTQIKGAQTEYGRTLQSFNIPARETNGNPYVDADSALKTDRDFTQLLDSFGGEDSVRKMAAAYSTTTDLSQKTRLARGLTLTRKMGNALYEVWQHTLLTNPVSQTKNIVSGVYTTFIAPNFELGGGYLISAARRKITGADDGVYAEDVQAQLFGQIMTLQEAFIASKDAFIGTNGLPSKVESTNVQGKAAGAPRISAFSGEAFGQAGGIGTAIDVLGNVLTAGRVAFRSLETGDAFFKVTAKRGELYKLAMISGRARGKEGEDLTDYIAEYVADPPAASMDKMEALAKYVTLQTELDAVGKAFNTIGKLPIVRYFTPFVKTPYNSSIYAFIDRSWAGLFWGNTRKMIDEGGAQRDEAIARVALGTAVGGSAVALALTGKCTGGGPANQALRKTLMESQDWRPYSCRVGGQWASYAGIEPFSSIMGVWADVAEIASSTDVLDPDFKFKNVLDDDGAQIFHDDFSYDDLVIAVIGATAYNVSNKAFMQGFSNLSGLIQDPSRRAKATSQDFITSLVPRGVAQLKKTGIPFTDIGPDPTMRQVRTFLDRLKSQIPGLSKDLQPSVDAYGNDKIYGVAGVEGDRNLSFGPDMMSPLKLGPANKKDVVTEERIRLKGIRFANNSDEIRIDGLRKPIELPDKMMYYRNQQRGKIAFKILEAQIKSDDYQELKKLSEAGNVEITRRMKMILQNIYADAKATADSMLLQHPVHGPQIQRHIEAMTQEQFIDDSKGTDQ